LVVRARAALESGQLDLARSLVEQAVPLAGVEAPLLRARLHALDPKGGFEALRAIEEARRLAPGDARVPATAAEIHAWAGRLEEAEAELQRGLAAGDVTRVAPELLRARGVITICTPGVPARAGLRFLEQARDADPSLPYLTRPLGQAHLLVAKELAAAGENGEALRAVERSLEHDPDEADARLMRADLLMALGEWGLGIGIYEELLADGLPLGPELAILCQKAGFWAVSVVQDRELGLDYLRRALELELPREEFGTTLRVLEEAASERAAEGAQALAAEEREAAREALEDALFLDPECLEAHNWLGDLHYGVGEFEQAVERWHRVIDTGRVLGIELPEAVHLKLARVQAVGLGEFETARETLEAYLVLEPTGVWAEETKALLAKLPPPLEGDG